jgi:hypothetical protein
MSKQRVIRKRVWAGDNAGARDVGENLRDVDHVVSQFVPTRLVAVDNVIYQPPLVLPMERRPVGVTCIHAERLNGTVQYTSAFADFKWADGELRMSFAGLVPGERYASLKFLVIG